MAASGVIDDLVLPVHLEAAEPPEARGLRRDEVRLLVSHIDTSAVEHRHFTDLPRLLSPGDLLVVNTSGTLRAALTVTSETGESFELHLSTQVPGRFWVVELRQPGPNASMPFHGVRAGMTLQLPGGGRATLLAPYPLVETLASPSRLWIAALQVPQPLLDYLDQHGFPIRYSYVSRPWPIEMYQTVFATQPGSAEMPSAGRPFTAELVTTLLTRGVQIVPIVLHTGVSSPEDHEPPFEEFYRVSGETASRINATRSAGHHVIAVGTTVVRALETVTDDRGITSPGHGWTNLVVTRERPVRSVNGLITGLHEPRATHLALLEAVAAAADARASASSRFTAAAHLSHAYAEAREIGYLWHEFGDSHLIIGGGGRLR